MDAMVMLLLVVVVLAGAGWALWAWLGGLRRSLDLRLSGTDAEMRRLADSSAAGQQGSVDARLEMATFKRAIERLQEVESERRTREERAWDELHRVSSVLAGSQAAGRAGENLLGETLSHLPPAMLERDFRVNGRLVEFALVLPDGRRLAIDSKWPAERELAALADATDGDARARAVQAIERTVARRAREVAAYCDPSATAPIAVAAIPDAAFHVLRRAHVDAYREGVVVVPYSMALPVVLTLHALTSRLGAVKDMQAVLADLGSVVDAVEIMLENKLERASTMLANANGELRGHVGRARTVMFRARQLPPADVPLASEWEVPRAVGLPP
jgi:DNA anti-recombination protein RmuC